MNESPQDQAGRPPSRSKLRLAATVLFLLLPSLALLLTHAWVVTAGVVSPLSMPALVVMLGVCIGGWIYALLSLLPPRPAPADTLGEPARRPDSSQAAWSLLCSWHPEPAAVVDHHGLVLGGNSAAAAELGWLPGVPFRMSLATRGFTEASADLLQQRLDDSAGGTHPFELHRASQPGDVRRGTLTGHRGGPWLLSVPLASPPPPLDRHLHRAEQLASIGQLVTGIAHEINTPLTIILGFAELARRPDADATLIQEHLGDIIQETRRATDLTEMLLHVSRHQETPRRPVDLHKLLDRCTQLVRINFKELDLNLVRHFAQPAPLPTADENQLLQVFLNLIINAAQALQEARTANPTITLTTTVEPARHRLRISVRDNGPGIAPELHARIFEPFFTTKQNHGTGLGLSVTRDLLRDLGGDVTVASPTDGGAEFTVTLLLEPPAPNA